MLVAVVYRPGSRTMSKDKGDFIREFSDLLELLVVNSCHITIVGDVNLHLDTSNDTHTRKFNSTLDCFGLTQAVHQPTHRAGHTLDILITRSDTAGATRVTVHPPQLISDHSFIVGTLPQDKPHLATYIANTRAWCKLDRKAFRADLKASGLCLTTDDWSGFTPDDMVEKYNKVMIELIDKHAPPRKVRKHYRPITPWFNTTCRTHKLKTRCLERVYRKSKRPEDKSAWLLKLAESRDIHKKAQDLYWQTLVLESAGNARKLWNRISSLMGKNKKTPIRPGLDAHRFKKVFEDKITDVRDSTLHAAAPKFSNFTGESLNNFEPLTIEDVIKLIKLSKTRTCSLDPLPTDIPKQYVTELAPFIRALFNKSIMLGYYPASFRLAEVTPMLKKAAQDDTLPENYRPISNLPYLSKLLERAVYNQLLQHLQANNLIPACQSAYRLYHSTETALLKVSSDALMASDQGKLTMLGLLDLSSAFDCVDHDILLHRLNVSYGIGSTALHWITSYLSARSQRVRYDGLVSDISVLVCGVPQGSVLGPMLFTLYIADVFKIAEQHGFSMHGYADDMQLYDSCLPGDIASLERRIILCVEEIHAWMKSNRLRLNAGKTGLIWLGSAKRLVCTDTSTLTVSGCSIIPADSVRNLGVILDSSLNFEKQVAKVVSNTYYHLRQIRKVRRSLSRDSCHALVRAAVISRLDYCNGLLGGATEHTNRQLNAVLRAAARLILKLPKTSSITDAMRLHLHWLHFPARVNFKLSTLAFKAQHGMAPPYLVDLCIPVSSLQRRHELRSNYTGLLVVPRCNTSTIGPRAFAVSAPTAWNNIPPELRCANIAFNSFRKCLKTHYFNTDLADL